MTDQTPRSREQGEEHALAHPIQVGTIIAGNLQLHVWAHRVDGGGHFHTATIGAVASRPDEAESLHIHIRDLPKLALLAQEAYRGACLSGGCVDWTGEAAIPSTGQSKRAMQAKRQAAQLVSDAFDTATLQLEAERAAAASSRQDQGSR